MLKTPVLFLIFNRPDVTARVFAAIRAARPKHLFIAADGPRSSHPTDMKLCSETRAIIDKVDWPCQLTTKLNATNRGCRLAVSSAITWFFENVEDGIILEDDCLPDPSFFAYCEDLLKVYRNETRVMHISGDNFQPPGKKYEADYYFSIYNHIWGWATWRRAWLKYDESMADFNLSAASQILRKISDAPQFRKYWIELFELTKRGKINTWDYQWTYAMWKNEGLAILPRVNLISNIGFGGEGTHTKIANWMSDLPTSELVLESHPSNISADFSADWHTSKKVYGIAKSYWSHYLQEVRTRLKLRTRIRNKLRFRKEQ